MTKQFGYGIAAGVLLMFAVNWVMPTNRFHVERTGSGELAEIDRQTGRVWIVDGASKTEVR